MSGKYLKLLNTNIPIQSLWFWLINKYIYMERVWLTLLLTIVFFSPRDNLGVPLWASLVLMSDILLHWVCFNLITWQSIGIVCISYMVADKSKHVNVQSIQWRGGGVKNQNFLLFLFEKTRTINNSTDRTLKMMRTSTTSKRTST